jgi:hypothetical protein
VALETQLECNPKGEKLAVVDDGEVGEDDKENLFEVEKRLENEDEEEDPPSLPPPPPPPWLCFSSVASAAAHTVKHCPILVFSPHHRMQLIQKQTNQANQANQANRTRLSPTSSSSPPPPLLPPPTSSYSYSLNNSSQIMIIICLTPYPLFFPQIQTRSMTNKLHQIQLVCFPFTKHNTKQN